MLIQNGYGGIITGGLGLPACYGMITMAFHVFTMRVIVTPPPGGGGGPYPPSGSTGIFYTPRGRFNPQSTKLVTIRIDFKSGKQWKREYIVGDDRAEYIITASNWINALQARISVGVDNIKRAGSKVSAMFTRDDK
jgi:hypothetical protein